MIKYILNENVTSMIRQVFKALKAKSRKGDFYNLVQQDMEDLGIDHTEEDIMKLPKLHWKKCIHN